MFHCPRCLSGFARHSGGCSEEPPSHATLVQMVGMLMTRVNALEKRKRGKEEEPEPCEMPKLEEGDLLGFLEHGVRYIVDKYEWPIKAFGKVLKSYHDGEWVAMSPATLDELTRGFFVQSLHLLLNDYATRTNLFDSPDNFYPNACAKVTSLETSAVKTAFMKTA